MRRLPRNALGAALGLVIDRAFGEPPNELHPVAWFGTSMTKVEAKLWADDREAGAVYATVGAGVGWLAGRMLRSTALAVGLASAGRELRRVGAEIGDACVGADLDRGRQLLPSLVGRDPSHLDESGIAAAVIESLAENTVDAVVAPVFWGVVAGAPGALGYRAINTMDAMVGHLSPRYRNFGSAAARLDDAANYVPARLFYALVQVAAWPRRHAVVEAVRLTASAHPSPNAGVAEAAVAGAIGIELGGPLHYGDQFQDRPNLGHGPRPEAADIAAANQLVDRVEQLLTVALFVAAAVNWRRTLRSQGP